MQFYWPTVVVLSICFLATLYHVSVPVRTNWSFNLPGAVFALVAGSSAPSCCAGCSPRPRPTRGSIYGPLAAPIAVLLWLYLVSIAVLIGAAVNAAFDTVFPQKATTRARLELVQRLRDRMTPRPTRHGLDSLPWPTTCSTTRGALPRQGRAARAQPVTVVGARPPAAGGAGDPGRHRAAGLLRPRRLHRQQRPRPAVSLVDAIYYTTVTLSTTGYGDIAPVTDARPG